MSFPEPFSRKERAEAAHIAHAHGLITLGEADRYIRFGKTTPCRRCEGTGTVVGGDGERTEECVCPECHGEGVVAAEGVEP